MAITGLGYLVAALVVWFVAAYTFFMRRRHRGAATAPVKPELRQVYEHAYREALSKVLEARAQEEVRKAAEKGVADALADAGARPQARGSVLAAVAAVLSKLGEGDYAKRYVENLDKAFAPPAAPKDAGDGD